MLLSLMLELLVYFAMRHAWDLGMALLATMLLYHQLRGSGPCPS